MKTWRKEGRWTCWRDSWPGRSLSPSHMAKGWGKTWPFMVPYGETNQWILGELYIMMNFVLIFLYNSCSLFLPWTSVTFLNQHHCRGAVLRATVEVFYSFTLGKREVQEGCGGVGKQLWEIWGNAQKNREQRIGEKADDQLWRQICARFKYSYLGNGLDFLQLCRQGLSIIITGFYNLASKWMRSPTCSRRVFGREGWIYSFLLFSGFHQWKMDPAAPTETQNVAFASLLAHLDWRI